ncbi:MAG: phosphoribosylanthranilate isomerase [Thermoanaerobaculia bacterium]
MIRPSRSRKPTQVKICGVTRVEDALLAVDLGADYLGLNFYPPSPRSLELRQAARIAEAVAGRITLVGVFVDPAAGELESISARLPLDLLQFHGDERPAELEPFGRRAIKVFRVASGFDQRQLLRYPEVGGFLFDAAQTDLYGGSGSRWPYETIAGIETDKTVFVAGGIRPENVRRAIELSRADAVDVCSGVESAPGLKDAQAMRRLFREVRDAKNGD